MKKMLVLLLLSLSITAHADEFDNDIDLDSLGSTSSNSSSSSVKSEFRPIRPGYSNLTFPRPGADEDYEFGKNYDKRDYCDKKKKKKKKKKEQKEIKEETVVEEDNSEDDLVTLPEDFSEGSEDFDFEDEITEPTPVQPQQSGNGLSKVLEVIQANKVTIMFGVGAVGVFIILLSVLSRLVFKRKKKSVSKVNNESEADLDLDYKEESMGDDYDDDTEGSWLDD